MLDEYEPNDVLALAGWSEENEYQEGVFNFLRNNIRPEHFEISTDARHVTLLFQSFGERKAT